ncbi:16S rRNA (uracil(1498)-N(3))-methyltransferase [Roseicyclus persicicus]|uniref:Ribosomal RNA small subunit methyltransferase E n=1 Tax=Roseicyclus persicicus TaxID=2650661 RepID=A0A7X6H1S9_9RHOB|nr:16S rRNA (uracil(1498)-N(3))-methyltransferase [Roseibacterium persicicum]NKX45593.1 16S rRNA (uracil(1498)-N(3))-methyltransferase [Roseibacterium persicicum]
MSDRPRIRLFVDQPLRAGQTVDLSREQANYLFNVMRLGPGDAVALFNGRDGEWRAVVEAAGKRGGQLLCEAQTAPLQPPPDLWLLFAPIKKARTDFIVEKAVEMGASRILPVQTDFTNAERTRQDRLQAHAVEAAEQCGATVVPPVEALRKLDAVLAAWPGDRRLILCDEAEAGSSAALPSLVADPGDDVRPGGGAAILIGPEGGFSPAERARLRALPFVTILPLGPRILRADTAAVAALALVQATLGDWR